MDFLLFCTFDVVLIILSGGNFTLYFDIIISEHVKCLNVSLIKYEISLFLMVLFLA